MFLNLQKRFGFASVFALALFAHARSADAAGAFVGAASVHPLEQRVAIALAPQRTTLWTSLRFDADAGTVALLVPVPSGAAIDTSSDAWFEALETATAPRIFPPNGLDPACPNGPKATELFQTAGDTAHTPTLPPEELIVLSDAGSVAAWANQHGLAIPADTQTTLESLSNQRFLAARFKAPGTPALTRTLRIAMPGSMPILPLALTRATDKELLVTSWLIGNGLGTFTNGQSITVDSSKLIWSAGDATTNYTELRSIALSSAGQDSALLECAGHTPLVNSVPLENGTTAIESVISALFERGAAYGDGNQDVQNCVAKAAAALSSVTPVAASCPRADFGIVDGTDTCTEQPAGYTDPEALRCGAGTDDLAVALSGSVPSDVWLTRQIMLIAAGTKGKDQPVDFGAGNTFSPVLHASSVDFSSCSEPDAGTTSSGSGTSSTSSTGSSGTVGTSSGNASSGGSSGVTVYPHAEPGCACAGTADTVDTYDEGDTAYDSDSDGCSGDTSDTSTDTWSDTTSDTAYDSGGDDCSGDTSDTSTDTTYDSGSDDCSGDTSDTSTDTWSDTGSDTGSDVDCSGGDTSTSDTSSSDSDCTIAAKQQSTGKKRGPRLSAMTLGLLALLAPLRRLGTRRRTQKRNR